jgi:hypothetical protein
MTREAKRSALSVDVKSVSLMPSTPKRAMSLPVVFLTVTVRPALATEAVHRPAALPVGDVADVAGGVVDEVFPPRGGRERLAGVIRARGSGMCYRDGMRKLLRRLIYRRSGCTSEVDGFRASAAAVGAIAAGLPVNRLPPL